MEFSEPDKDTFQNYVWDTQALNRLAIDKEMVIICKSAIDAGHRYYITSVQERELMGIPDRTMQYEDANAWGTHQTKTFEVMEHLKFRRLSCIALLYQNFWTLDGSMRILETSGSRIEMFNEIYHNNNHHKRDATIAEAVIYHGCILITNDKRLRNKVNKFFPECAITYEKYKDTILELQQQEALDHAD
jgi:hypothetical protein